MIFLHVSGGKLCREVLGICCHCGKNDCGEKDQARAKRETAGWRLSHVAGCESKSGLAGCEGHIVRWQV